MENEFEVQRSLGRIEGGIIEIKSDIGLMRTDHALLRAEFTKLEAGRLTKLESAFAVHQAEVQAKTRNIALIYSGISAIIISVLSVLIINWLQT